MNADEFARRCLRRVTGQLTLEDQWIPALPDYLIEFCQEAGIEPLPSALLAYLCDVYGVTCAHPHPGDNGFHITIPDQPDADTLMALFRAVPLTLLPPEIRIVDPEGKHIPTWNPETRSHRITTCLIHTYPEGYPYDYEIARRWRESRGHAATFDD
jgi:hypothetical protein